MSCLLVYIKQYFAEIIAILGVAGTVITAIISGITARNTEIKKANYKRREDIYLDVLTWFEDLRANSYRIYNDEYIQKLMQMKTKMKLFASDKSIELFESLWWDVMSIYRAFKEFEQEQKVKCCIEGVTERFWKSEDEDDYEDLEHQPTERELQQYEYEIDKYKSANIYSKELLKQKLDELYESIKTDLDIK